MKPANYARRFYGPSIMRVGIEKSRNLIDRRLAMDIGMPVIKRYAEKFGINEDLPEYLSMSLGAGETNRLPDSCLWPACKWQQRSRPA